MFKDLATEINKIFPFEILENQPSQIVAFLTILLIGIITQRFISPFLTKALYMLIKRVPITDNLQVFVKKMQPNVEFLLMIIYLYLSVLPLQFPKTWELVEVTKFGLKMVLARCYAFLLIFTISNIFIKAINIIGNIMIENAKATETMMDDHIIPFVKELAKVFVVIVAFFVILGNVFDINVVAMITGLGIGGIAVALAGKETLENLFASFTIFLDKPFIVGDWVKVNDIVGRVERVGFRSTQLRTIERGLLTMPNKMMTDRPVENWTEREIWRAQFNFGLSYSTPKEKLYKIKKEMHEYLQSHDNTTADNQIYLYEFGQSSLNFTVFFFAQTNNFFELQKIRDEINFRLYEIVQQNEASFALPTQVVYFKKENASGGFDL
jgi:MscS family membrane protein